MRRAGTQLRPNNEAFVDDRGAQIYHVRGELASFSTIMPRPPQRIRRLSHLLVAAADNDNDARRPI
ncbi:hypothetical protein BD626DRAFT_515695, partial [Schizophyllum amplum]